MRIQATSLAAVVALACATSAHAGPIVTYDFAGKVSSVLENDNFKLNGTITAGMGVTGSFTYEAGALPGFSFSPLAGTGHPEASILFSVDIGGGAFVWNSGALNFFNPEVNVFDNDAILNDEFEIFGGEAPATGLTLPSGATTSTPFAIVADLFFTDPTETALTGQDIPAVLDPSKFEFKTLSLEGGLPQGNNVLLGASDIGITLDSLTLEPSAGGAVPEPASIVGFGLGALAVVVGVGRRKLR